MDAQFGNKIQVEENHNLLDCITLPLLLQIPQDLDCHTILLTKGFGYFFDTPLPTRPGLWTMKLQLDNPKSIRRAFLSQNFPIYSY